MVRPVLVPGRMLTVTCLPTVTAEGADTPECVAAARATPTCPIASANRQAPTNQPTAFLKPSRLLRPPFITDEHSTPLCSRLNLRFPIAAASSGLPRPTVFRDVTSLPVPRGPSSIPRARPRGLPRGHCDETDGCWWSRCYSVSPARSSRAWPGAAPQLDLGCSEWATWNRRTGRADGGTESR